MVPLLAELSHVVFRFIYCGMSSVYEKIEKKINSNDIPAAREVILLDLIGKSDLVAKMAEVEQKTHTLHICQQDLNFLKTFKMHIKCLDNAWLNIYRFLLKKKTEEINVKNVELMSLFELVQQQKSHVCRTTTISMDHIDNVFHISNYYTPDVSKQLIDKKLFVWKKGSLSQIQSKIDERERKLQVLFSLCCSNICFRKLGMKLSCSSRKFRSISWSWRLL